MCQEISALKAQGEEVKRQAVEDYKASKEYCQEKPHFAQPTFVEGMDDT